MNWNNLETSEQLAQIINESATQPVMIFKHSTRCSISSAAFARLERSWPEETVMKAYYLDLLKYRALSNQIAEIFGVEHESPQALLISNGSCIYSESHMGIDVHEMLNML